MDPRDAGPSPSIVRLFERVRGEDGPYGPTLVADLDRAFGAHEADVRRIVRLRKRRAPQEQVDDLVQDVLLTAWRSLAHWNPAKGTFRQWLFGITRNLCRNDDRKLRDVLTEDGQIEGEEEAPSALRGLERAERERVVLEAAAESLDALEQDVAFARWIEELGRDEIAEEYGLADANAVRVVLIRCKRKVEKAVLARIAALRHGTSFVNPTGP